MKDGKSVSLPITSPKASDSGYYQCYAANSNNWIQKTTQVVVTGKNYPQRTFIIVNRICANTIFTFDGFSNNFWLNFLC